MVHLCGRFLILVIMDYKTITLEVDPYDALDKVTYIIYDKEGVQLPLNLIIAVQAFLTCLEAAICHAAAPVTCLS